MRPWRLESNEAVERINEMRIASWNERTFYRAGEMNELAKEMDNYKIDVHVRALQEIKWSGEEL